MRVFVVAAMILAAVANVRAQEPPTGLTIRVIDLVPSRGEVVIALFDSPEAYEQRSPALRSVVLPVEGEASEWRVHDLEPGEYAAVAYQDLNGNGTLDKGRLGIPKEPYGFSSGARAAFGPPSFDQARFAYDGESAAVEMRLKRRSGGVKSPKKG